MDNGDDWQLSGPKVDLTKVAALNQRRSVAFMNHFLLHTSNFLNNFAAVSEDQLSAQSLEIQKLEISLNILEAKLASIPGLENAAPKEEKTETGSATSAPTADTPTVPSDVQGEPDNNIPEPPPSNVITVKQDPRYARFLKMVNVGVPKVAIENKMRLEGLDPTLLDKPDAPVPDAVPQSSNSDSDADSSSSDEFSD